MSTNRGGGLLLRFSETRSTGLGAAAPLEVLQLGAREDSQHRACGRTPLSHGRDAVWQSFFATSCAQPLEKVCPLGLP